MITDLKRDTIYWQKERAKTGNRCELILQRRPMEQVLPVIDYRKSETHNRRQGPTRPLQLPVAKRGTSSPQRSVSSPRRRARSAFLAAGGFLGEAGASVLIHNYRPLRDRGIAETWFTRHPLPTSTLENIPTSGPLLKQAWRCVSNSLQRGILLPRVVCLPIDSRASQGNAVPWPSGADSFLERLRSRTWTRNIR